MVVLPRAFCVEMYLCLKKEFRVTQSFRPRQIMDAVTLNYSKAISQYDSRDAEGWTLLASTVFNLKEALYKLLVATYASTQNKRTD